MHATSCNEILHMDYLYIGPNYIHVLLDDFSKFIKLDFIGGSPAGINTADSIEDWGALFGIPNTWITDGGSHYVNEIIAKLSDRCGGTKHHVVVAYSPWANGTVEVLMSQILKVLRTLC